MNKKELVQLKQKDLKDLRVKWHIEQNMICPILKQQFDHSFMVVDHQHKLKSELPDETGKGICRGSIHTQANVLEGKISNAFKRFGLDKHIELPDFLRNMADYLENNKIHNDTIYIHPKEQPKKLKLKKTSYNKLVKVCKTKIPKYTGNFTVQLAKLFKKYEIDPEFYKN